MRLLTALMILAMLLGLLSCSSGGLSTPFVVVLNLSQDTGEVPLPISGTIQIEGGTSQSLADYSFTWRISTNPNFISNAGNFSYVFDVIGTHKIDVFVTSKTSGQTVHASGTVKVLEDLGELQVKLQFIEPVVGEGEKAPVGKAPFTVEMGSVVSGGEPPYYYEWDYNTDGKYEGFGFNVDQFKGTFASPGTYTLTLKVTDKRFTTASDSRFINVLPSNPVAVANALPSEGKAPLFVVFSAQGSYDPDGKIVFYEWDFDGDGVYDYDSPTTGSTSSGYVDPGNYYPTLRVTDNDGLVGLSTTQVVVTF